MKLLIGWGALVLAVLGLWWLGQLHHAAEEAPKLYYAFLVAVLFMGGMQIAASVTLGSRNALGEFMEVLSEVMRWFRDPDRDDPPEHLVAVLSALAIRNAGTLVANAIIVYAVLDYLSHW